MFRRHLLVGFVLLAAAQTLAASERSERSEMLLARAWPHDPHASLRDLGRGTGIVFSPDLSVDGNCRFYEALGFACFQDTDWSRVLDAIHDRNVREPERAIRTLILETHGTNGNGLKLQKSYAPRAERSYISVGALQERLEPEGIRSVIISACNSGRLMRPSIYNQIDRYNGDRLFLPATCGILDASPSFDPERSSILVVSPATSRVETTVAGSIRELSPAARRAIAAAAKERGFEPPSRFAASDILCQIMLRDPHLELVAGAWVEELSREHRSEADSDRLFARFVRLINDRAP